MAYDPAGRDSPGEDLRLWRKWADDGTNFVDWGDGSLLRISNAAAFKYNLPEGTILFSTRLNTSVLVDPKTPGAAPRLRHPVSNHGLPEQGRRPVLVRLAPVAISAKRPEDERMLVGSGQTSSSREGDGTIQIYYDNELVGLARAWREESGRTVAGHANPVAGGRPWPGPGSKTRSSPTAISLAVPNPAQEWRRSPRSRPATAP